MKIDNNKFEMYCPKCGRKYIVSAFNENPVCKKCKKIGLDFEKPKEKG